MKDKEQKYFEALNINEGAYFYREIRAISEADIAGAFKSVKQTVIGYKQICNVIKETVKYNDTNSAEVSLLIYYINTPPSFLPILDKKLALQEKFVCYVLFIEIGGFLVLFSLRAKGLSDFKKKLMPIAPSDLCGAIIEDDTRFTRINTSNMNLNPNAIRNKSWEANDLSTVMSTSGTNHSVLRGIRMAHDDDEINVTLNTSRVAKFASDRKEIIELCRWCDKIIKRINAPKDIEESFLRHFAKPVKWSTLYTQLTPTYILIDTHLIKSIIDSGDYKFVYESGDDCKDIGLDTIHFLINRLDRCLSLTGTENEQNYETSVVCSKVSIKLNRTGIKIENIGLLDHVKLRSNSPDDQVGSLASIINFNKAFSIGFDKLQFIYSNGGLNQDIGILNKLDSVLSIFVPLKEMYLVTSEKGNIKDMTDFQQDTVFHVVEEYFMSKGARHIVCDDMGYEVADHIAITDNTISFIHSKAKGNHGASLSASNFQVVIGQALKNIGSVRDLPIDKKVKSWNSTFFAGSKIPCNRYGDIKDFKNAYTSVLGSPNGIKEICLAVDFISKSKLQDAFSKLKKGIDFTQKNYVIQMVWLLNELISSCKEADMNCRILCNC